MTKQQLIQYILRQLGSPVIHIEIAQEQIEDVISDALDLFREYHADALKESWKTVNLIAGTQEYVMSDDVFAIKGIFGSKNNKLIDFGAGDEDILLKSFYVGNGFFSDSYRASDIAVTRQQYDMYLNTIKKDYVFDYSFLERTLNLLVDVQENETVKILCDCFLDLTDTNYSSHWLKQYCVSCVGVIWSGNIGKYSGVSLPGSGQYNYSEIFNKYNDMKNKLEEEILDRYSSSFGVFIG